MKIASFFIICFSIIFNTSFAQKSSFIVLGDIHYDLLQDHNMNWLNTKPDDLRQVTKEYTVYTETNWIDFTRILMQKAQTVTPSLKAVIQLGDLSEGLAGSEQKAEQMASNAMKAIEAVNMHAPWILTKGNHDVTGPGAVEAFQKFYVPMIRKQTNNPEIKNASYSYTIGDVQITCLDPWDKNTDMVSFLENEYGPSVAENIPEWQPETLEARKAILTEEAKYVSFFKQTDLPGYAIIKTDGKKGTIELEYYAAFGKKPYDRIDLTRLLNL